MIKIYGAVGDLPEELYPSEEDWDQGLTTADPEVILQTISNLAPGERLIIQNVSRVRASMAEYYCRKEPR